MKLGPRGIWVSLESLDLEGRIAAAQRIEALGYTALWHPMAMQRDLMVVASQLLEASPWSGLSWLSATVPSHGYLARSHSVRSGSTILSCSVRPSEETSATVQSVNGRRCVSRSRLATTTSRASVAPTAGQPAPRYGG